ncbi:MAG: radical SAM protein [Ruminococcus sp.]|uniref:SPL family radical SAM protein n=1 Tax=Ruminococcus sp. TaxID=41978 RepID=UPI0025E5AC76|nr:radical SAM protein [Ruminococcus sp.]MCR4795173.1 radical SAM protein [Ruminococcus sp.]
MHFVEAKGILSSKNGMNLYRGCTHGCIYCDSRSKCYNMPHAFEDIEVKINAPQLLEKALRSKRKKCIIGTGAMCDPYMPVEAELKLTRRCLELIERYQFGAAVQTKSDLILRDIDLLTSINEQQKAVVQLTMTTFDDELCGMIEPNVCRTSRRFEVLMEMKKRDIPTIVWLTPFLPYINDTEENLIGLLNYCAEAGVKGIISFGIGLTLREGNREYFYSALDRHFSGLPDRYRREFGYSYVIPSPDSSRLMGIINDFCERYGIMHDNDRCFEYMSELPEKYEQLSLF